MLTTVFNDSTGQPSIHVLYDQFNEANSFDIFKLGAVRALIEVRWAYIFPRIIIFLLIPYLGFFITFIYYTNHDYMAYTSSYCKDDTERRQGLAT